MKQKLSELIGEALGEKPRTPYSRPEFEERVKSFLTAHGCYERPGRVRTEEELHRWVLRYALLMAQVTYLRLGQPAPAPPPDLVNRFEESLPQAPEESETYSQGRIDPASSCRRAMEVHRSLGGEGPILFLGDDDGTSVALALLGVANVWAVDIDPRVLDWLRGSGLPLSLQKVDLRYLPDSLLGRFQAVVTDPVRDGFLGGLFLRAAQKCLRPGGLLFWADHPDWNPGYPRVQRWTERLELEPIRVLENWHSYRGAYRDDSTAEFFGLDPDWLRRLAGEVRLWSHLHVLRRPCPNGACSAGV